METKTKVTIKTVVSMPKQGKLLLVGEKEQLVQVIAGRSFFSASGSLTPIREIIDEGVRTGRYPPYKKDD